VGLAAALDHAAEARVVAGRTRHAKRVPVRPAADFVDGVADGARRDHGRLEGLRRDRGVSVELRHVVAAGEVGALGLHALEVRPVVHPKHVHEGRARRRLHPLRRRVELRRAERAHVAVHEHLEPPHVFGRRQVPRPAHDGRARVVLQAERVGHQQRLGRRWRGRAARHAAAERRR
jgi:hypothetical protein